MTEKRERAMKIKVSELKKLVRENVRVRKAVREAIGAQRSQRSKSSFPRVEFVPFETFKRRHPEMEFDDLERIWRDERYDKEEQMERTVFGEVDGKPFISWTDPYGDEGNDYLAFDDTPDQETDDAVQDALKKRRGQ